MQPDEIETPIGTLPVSKMGMELLVEELVTTRLALRRLLDLVEAHSKARGEIWMEADCYECFVREPGTGSYICARHAAHLVLKGFQ